MKTVLICSAQAPFVTGGAEILVQELRDNLARRGFRVDVASVPFRGYPASELVRQALAWRLIDVKESGGHKVDLVIPTKFPSYLVEHPCKVAWLFHQYREAYDLFGTEVCSLTDSPEDQQTREAIRTLDDTSLAECRTIYSISRNVANRLSQYNHLDASPLYPPPRNLGRHYCEAHGDFLLYAGRLESVKRPTLLVDALARVRSGARLKIAGAGSLEGELRRQIERAGVGDRVELLGFVSDQDLLDLYARCRATLYAPLNEDYGYVTVESFLSRKPVVTTTDSGGVLEFVEDGVNGTVAAPEPDALAEAIDRLWALPEARLQELGAEGHSRVQGISWDGVIDRLTESIR
jgi:glycosyltransferase involved in cell wall biosynthesis